MQISLLIASMLVFGVAASGPGTAQAGPSPVQNDRPEAGCTLRIHVDGLRNSTGVVGSVIFKSPDGWPEDTTNHFITGRLQFQPGKREATAMWENLPPGDYGVAVIHDENRNRKLDRNFIGDSEGGLWIREQSARGIIGAAVRRPPSFMSLPGDRDQHSPAIQVDAADYFFSPAANFGPRARGHVFEDRLQIAVLGMRSEERRGDEVLAAGMARVRRSARVCAARSESVTLPVTAPPG